MSQPRKARFLIPAGRRSSLPASLTLLLALHAPGCESLRGTAGTGQDLLENPARTAMVRTPAGIGAIAGYVVAVPFAAVLVPTVWMPSTYVKNAEQGDIYISPVSASFDYGHGIGAAVLGAPFNAFERLFREEPGFPPPGTVDEEGEIPPGRLDWGRDFSVKPPPAAGGAPPEAPGLEPGPEEAAEKP